MRTITNKAGLPEPMYNALAANTYVGGGDISATRVIAPPRIVTLRRFHEDEIVEDASDRVWSLLGNSVHRILELSTGPEKPNMPKVETRLQMPFQGHNGLIWQVSAQDDVYHNKAIYDYKVTSVWSFMFAEKPEWTKQLNIQGMLHRDHGDEVNELYIVAILRDWSIQKSINELDYPKCPVIKISVPVWTQEECKEYVQRRVELHQRCQIGYRDNKDPDKLPLCTPEERWYRGASFAVKFQEIKTGKVNVKAKRVLKTLTDAREYIENNAIVLPKGKQFAPVEERPGTNIRCERYCDVAKFCPFGQAILAEKAKEKPVIVNETNGGEEQSEEE